MVGGTAYVRWDSGPAFPQPAHWHAWRQIVMAITDNTVTFNCPYDGNGNGKATIFWSLSQAKDPNTSRHNTFLGHTAAWQAKRANNSVVIGSLSAALADNISNSVVIGFNAGVKATTISNSVVIGGNASSQLSALDNYLTIADVITGDLSAGKIGVYVPITQTPLADLHLRAKDDAGSGRTTTANGLLIESSATASVHLDGRNAGNLDFEQGGVLKGGFRYSYGNKFLTLLMGGASSWRFDENHAMYPVVDKRNSLGLPNQRLKEIFVDTQPKEDNSDKAATTKWVKSLFTQSLHKNGWSISPSGEIEQWGEIAMQQGSSSVTVTFPIAFNECFFVLPIDISATGNIVAMSVGSTSNISAVIQGTKFAGTIKWYAKGR